MTSKKAQKRHAGSDSTAEFEELLKKASDREQYVLILFVTGTTPRSSQAISNIHALCEEYLSGHYDLRVVDIYQQPSAAAEQQIIAAPTLIKELPKPPKRLIGDLSDRDKVLIGLNLIDKKSLPGEPSKTRWIKL
jgi:circadian clock protein KaiB